MLKQTVCNVWLVFLLVPCCENATLNKTCLGRIASSCRVLPWLDVSLLHCGVELYRNAKINKNPQKYFRFLVFKRAN